MGRKYFGKRRNCSFQAISPFPTVFSKDLHCRRVKNQGLFGKGLPFPKQQILDSSKLKEFADDNFKVDKNCESSPKRLKKKPLQKKGEIGPYEQYLLSHSGFERLVLQTREKKGLFEKGSAEQGLNLSILFLFCHLFIFFYYIIIY